ncbi:MAG: hypothetical protein M5U28_56940, partial [Sandaracinaceae bacterium]|nr:hypothetical protein [Sandaracinaceae bacterium]
MVPGGPVPALRGGESFELVLGELDVLNLETRGLNADFHRHRRGGERARGRVRRQRGVRRAPLRHLRDPRVLRRSPRGAAAPDRYAGRHFVIGRQHSRRLALARPTGMGGLDVSEPEWLRVV